MSNSDFEAFEPKRRGLWFKLLIGFCALVLIIAGWLLLERMRGQAALQRYEKELIAKGEKLTFAELLPPLPDGPNKAIELVGLCNSFRTGAVMLANAPQSMKCVAPGKALVITKEAGWFDKKAGKLTWEQVGKDLDSNRDVLDELGTIVRSPVLRYPLNYRGINTLLPHVARQKRAAQWLSASALYKVHLNDISGAIDDIESILLLARFIENEPILISQLVRVAVVQIAVQNCWPLLQHDVGNAELVRLQKLFCDINMIGPMTLALQGERAMDRDTFAMIRSEQINFDAIADSTTLDGDDDDTPRALDNVPYGNEMKNALRAHVIFPIWRQVFSYEDERHALEEMQRMIDGTRTATKARSAAGLQPLDAILKEKHRAGGEYRSWKYFVTGLLVPATAKAGNRAFRSQTHCEMIVAAVALKRYHMRHKKHPNDLHGLVPEFVPQVPIDYMDGKPLRYRLDGDQFVLWSVGLDGKDNGGTPKSEADFSWMLGLDDVWPQPASEAEAAAHRESQQKR